MAAKAAATVGAGDWLGLAGKVCVVTGAGGGIGRAVAAGFAAAGAKVALLDLNEATLAGTTRGLAPTGAQTVAHVCDTTKVDLVRAVAERVERDLGSADVLVNNAGILRPGPLESLKLEEWNQILAVNLTGYFLCAQAFGRQMLARKKGALVHIASIAATEPQPWSGAYSVTKAGVVMLSRQLALEWGPQGVRSNVVAPGAIRTPLSEAFYQAPGVVEARERIIPSRRIGYPQDIADPVIYLASDRASYVNGEEVLADGGLSRVIMGLLPRPGHEAPK
jgi:NAD(P)-dependent dehydrogenase (short-subunit alcohol dehydrogenase family)